MARHGKYRSDAPEYEWLTIDGNWTIHPAAYCKSKKAVLTVPLMKMHKCRYKEGRGKCKALEEDVDFDVSKRR